MRTTLAYIGQSADAAVAAEMERPTLSQAAETAARVAGSRVIAGFPAFDESVAEGVRTKSLDARRDRLKSFRADRDRVSGQLERRNIVPLAILPKAAWERICTQTGLFMIDPDDSGRVHVDTSMLKDFDDKATALLDKLQVIGNLVLVVAGLAAVVTTFLVFGFIQAVLAFVGAMILMWIFNSTVYSKKIYEDENGRTDATVTSSLHQAYVRRQIERFGMQPAPEILKAFFPDGISPAHSEVKAKVLLPQAPDDVSSILLKAQGLQLKTALVGEALSFAEKPAHIVSRGLDKKLKEDLEARDRVISSWPDPIIYHEEGTAIAVIAQFGDFPVEKEAVDLALFSEHLI